MKKKISNQKNSVLWAFRKIFSFFSRMSQWRPTTKRPTKRPITRTTKRTAQTSMPLLKRAKKSEDNPGYSLQSNFAWLKEAATVKDLGYLNALLQHPLRCELHRASWLRAFQQFFTQESRADMIKNFIFSVWIIWSSKKNPFVHKCRNFPQRKCLDFYSTIPKLFANIPVELSAEYTMDHGNVPFPHPHIKAYFRNNCIELDNKDNGLPKNVGFSTQDSFKCQYRIVRSPDFIVNLTLDLVEIWTNFHIGVNLHLHLSLPKELSKIITDFL